MKKLSFNTIIYIVVATFVTTAFACSFVLAAQKIAEQENAQAAQNIADGYDDENKPFSGMCFNTENVEEAYDNGGSYSIVYDDADANMFDVEIPVDKETFEAVVAAMRSGEEAVGELTLNEDEHTFTFSPEWSYSKATADAGRGKVIKAECLMPNW